MECGSAFAAGLIGAFVYQAGWVKQQMGYGTSME